jgi:hypothetical protein
MQNSCVKILQVLSLIGDFTIFLGVHMSVISGDMGTAVELNFVFFIAIFQI